MIGPLGDCGETGLDVVIERSESFGLPCFAAVVSIPAGFESRAGRSQIPQEMLWQQITWFFLCLATAQALVTQRTNVYSPMVGSKVVDGIVPMIVDFKNETEPEAAERYCHERGVDLIDLAWLMEARNLLRLPQLPDRAILWVVFPSYEVH